jgi:hypothetical protein
MFIHVPTQQLSCQSQRQQKYLNKTTANQGENKPRKNQKRRIATDFIKSQC